MNSIKKNFLEGLENSFFGQVRKILVASHRMTSKFISESQIPIQVDQLPVFMAIYLHENLSQQEVANTLCRDKASVKRTISHLEKNGLVSIKPNPVDKRANQVSLTKEGEHAVHLINEVINKVDHTLREIATTDLDQLTHSLKILADNMIAGLPDLQYDHHCQPIKHS